MQYYYYIISIISLLIIPHQAFAITAKEKATLMTLGPQTRIEQACNIAAMESIQKETKLAPEKMLAYAFGDTELNNLTFKAPNAAIRANRIWYRLSYICTTKDDYLTVESITTELGEVVPRSIWRKHHLVPAAA